MKLSDMLVKQKKQVFAARPVQVSSLLDLVFEIEDYFGEGFYNIIDTSEFGFWLRDAHPEIAASVQERAQTKYPRMGGLEFWLELYNQTWDQRKAGEPLSYGTVIEEWLRTLSREWSDLTSRLTDLLDSQYDRQKQLSRLGDKIGVRDVRNQILNTKNLINKIRMLTGEPR